MNKLVRKLQCLSRGSTISKIAVFQAKQGSPRDCHYPDGCARDFAKTILNSLRIIDLEGALSEARGGLT